MTSSTATSNASFDAIIVCAGVVGATVASEILRLRPRARIAALEKEATPAQHASGRDSRRLSSSIRF